MGRHGPKPEDLKGRVFSRLTVLHVFPHVDKNGLTHWSDWLCRCVCGALTVAGSSHLRKGRKVSCGCYRKEQQRASATTHGRGKTREYLAWKNMLGRCADRANMGYGGRGITVCERWHQFPAFFEDMGPCPAGLTLDRIDTNGNYTPENCRWVTLREQMRNQRRNVWVTLGGERRLIGEWAALAGMPRPSFATRLGNGWTLEQALTTPGRKWSPSAEVLSLVRELAAG